MTLAPGSLFLIAAAILFGIGAHGLMRRQHPLRKVLALNLCTTAVFLFLVAPGAGNAHTDPVPHAMVLTGIVIAVSTTAVALALIVRLRS